MSFVSSIFSFEDVNSEASTVKRCTPAIGMCCGAVGHAPLLPSSVSICGYHHGEASGIRNDGAASKTASMLIPRVKLKFRGSNAE